VNARVPKCVTEEQTKYKVATSGGSESLSAIPTVVTGRQRSAMYDGAICSVRRHRQRELDWSTGRAAGLEKGTENAGVENEGVGCIN